MEEESCRFMAPGCTVGPSASGHADTGQDRALGRDWPPPLALAVGHGSAPRENISPTLVPGHEGEDSTVCYMETKGERKTTDVANSLCVAGPSAKRRRVKRRLKDTSPARHAEMPQMEAPPLERARLPPASEAGSCEVDLGFRPTLGRRSPPPPSWYRHGRRQTAASLRASAEKAGGRGWREQ
ncbi:hypothetical protein SKAU_G00253660 [Synaphobranchus kaupii]|uniref:Uncharacterized protein n=1 Tax=Synaphobranchus kaupii TaxID=118154 RepID=A0A9Q1F3G5_SYNKA|nr:hypothetical protein SKAU_G00253660 [Synaphobranchus kaupii]